MSETAVTSFIIRFMQEQEPDQEPPIAWRGLIRHVQSSTETRFSHIEEALAFMNGYVDIGGRLETGDWRLETRCHTSIHRIKSN